MSMGSRGIRHDQRKLVDIKIGKRHRNELGDIASLADSIKAHGPLQLPGILDDGTLLFGYRRVQAFKLLGWEISDFRVFDSLEIALAEAIENLQRKNLTPSEVVELKRDLEPLLTKEANERMRRGKPVENFSKGRTLDKIAKSAGMSRPTLQKAEAVVAQAEVDPKFRKIVEEMDRTGKVSGAYKRMNIIKQAEALRSEKPPLPGNGPYSVIVVDPPWEYNYGNIPRRGTCPYPTMSIAEICSTDVPSLAAENCVIWVWTTNQHMREGFEVLDAWGFQQRSILTWVKDRMGCGNWLRGQTEHCLLASRGHPIVQLTNQTTVVSAAVREHSRKPDEFYELVESLCPASRYAELFSTMQRANWDCHGAVIGSQQNPIP